jgi:hypothetical protein
VSVTFFSAGRSAAVIQNILDHPHHRSSASSAEARIAREFDDTLLQTAQAALIQRPEHAIEVLQRAIIGSFYKPERW